MPIVLFSDDFESGTLSAWDAATISGPGQNVAASVTAARQGSYGLLAMHNQTGSDQPYEAKVSEAIPDTENQRVYLHAWVRLANVLSVGYGANGSKAVLALKASDGQPLLWLSVRAGGLLLSYMSKAGVITSLNPNVVMPPGVWRRFRLVIDRAGIYPLVQGFISTDGTTWTLLGAAIDQSTGLSGIWKYPARVEAGVVHIANFEQGRYNVHVDEVEARHSLGNVTEWATLFDVQIPTYSASRGAVNRPVMTTYEQPLASDVSFGYSRAIRFDYAQPVTGSVPSLRTAPALVVGTLRTTSAIQALATKLAQAIYAQPLMSSVLGARIGPIAGIGAVRIRLRNGFITLKGAILPVKTVEISQQAWGASILSDEAVGTASASSDTFGATTVIEETHGAVTATGETHGAVVASDEKG